MPLWLLGQSSGGVDLGPAVQQIGIGALIAVPAYSALWLLWKRLQQCLTDKDAVQLERLARERELSDKLAPLLAMAAETLAKAPERFDRALADAQSSTRQGELDRKIEDLQRIVERAVRDRGKA